MNIAAIHKRIESLAPAMQGFYRERLNKLASNRSDADSFEAFEKRLRIAEELSGSIRFTPATRVRR